MRLRSEMNIFMLCAVAWLYAPIVVLTGPVLATSSATTGRQTRLLKSQVAAGTTAAYQGHLSQSRRRGPATSNDVAPITCTNHTPAPLAPLDSKTNPDCLQNSQRKVQSSSAAGVRSAAASHAITPSGGGSSDDGAGDDLFQQYTSYVNKVDGWADPLSRLLAHDLTLLQHSLGYYGSVAEIGVHHGKYFLALATAAARCEAKAAIDLFEDGQAANLDQSGRGSAAIVGGHVNKLRVPNVRLARGNSLMLTPSDITTTTTTTTTASGASLRTDKGARVSSSGPEGKALLTGADPVGAGLGLGPVRFFSVDGAHFREATMRDLSLAACTIGAGGIIAVDDFVNPVWLGVMQGVVEFLQMQQAGKAGAVVSNSSSGGGGSRSNAARDASVLPFLWACNKLYFTTASTHQQYFNHVSKLPYLACSSNAGHHVSRYVLGGAKVCIHMDDVKQTCGLSSHGKARKGKGKGV